MHRRILQIFTICVLFCQFLFFSPQLIADNWPGWRGDGSGISHETGIVREWNETENTLNDIPILGGTDGFAARHSRLQAKNGQEIESEVTAIVNMIAVGRLVVAPPRMNKEISDCLEQTLLRVLQNPRFQAQARQAGLSLDIAGSEQVRQELFSVSRKIENFIPIIDKAIRKVRK